jgi:hypothetical protein
MSGYAVYDASNNRLDVIRPTENTTRYIKCNNLNPDFEKVFGVEIHGDEIWVIVGPQNNPRPNKKYIYFFSSLSGGGSRSI